MNKHFCTEIVKLCKKIRWKRLISIHFLVHKILELIIAYPLKKSTIVLLNKKL